MKQQRIQLVSLAFLIFISNSCIKKPVSRVLSTDDNDSSTNYETPETFYGSKTPYNPRQKPSNFQSVPEGFKQVYTQVVSRHSSRGLSSPGSDLVLKAMLEKAESEKALTALGAELLADVNLMIKLCALMGYKVEGIAQPGYGNLSALGIKEHQNLGARHYARNKVFYDSIANAVPRRKIEIVSSGKDRAVDSKEFFSQSLAHQNPALKSHIVESDAVKISSNPSLKGKDGVDRFTLYFHKLNEKDDNVLAETDEYYKVYQDSQKYQTYKKSPELKAIISKIYEHPSALSASQAVAERLVDRSFLTKLGSNDYIFSNNASLDIISDDGKFKTKVTGDGEDTLSNTVDFVRFLYDLYTIAPGMSLELAGRNFDKYIPSEQAALFNELQDAEDFYEKGPSYSESNEVTVKMAEMLLEDLFHEVENIEEADFELASKLRFTHAEHMSPIAGLLGIKNASEPLAMSASYSYANSKWRGQNVIPYASNIQWDVFQNTKGKLLVRMLYLERETHFKKDCEKARHSKDSFYYDFKALKDCYKRD